MKSLLTDHDYDVIERLLTRAKDAYYNKGKFLKVRVNTLPVALQLQPIIKNNIVGTTVEIEDHVYDNLETLLKAKRPNAAVLQKVGAPVSRNREKVKLPFYVGSLDKIMPDNAMDWLMRNKGPYVLSDKLDGSSFLLVSKAGKVRAFTRGEGDVGQEVTPFLAHMKLPKNMPKDFAARGEAIIDPKVFASKWKTSAQRKGYKNPRNMVAGILNRKQAHEALADIDVVFFELIEPRMQYSKGLEWLKAKGFNTVDFKTFPSLTPQQLSAALTARRTKGKYEIDGLVVTLDKNNHVNSDAKPSFQVAYKENRLEDTVLTRVQKVDWEVSKRGRIIPRVFIDPVELKGVTVSKATAFNAKFVVDNKIGPNSIIRIQRSKDVIPDIVEVTKGTKAQMPTGVPFEWDANKTHLLVKGQHKTTDIKLIAHFFTVLGIEGFKAATVKRLYDEGYTTLRDILDLTVEELMEIPGFQDKKATKLYNDLHKAIKKVPLDKLMEASGQFGLNFGSSRLSKLVREFPKLDFTVKKIVEVEGFQVKTAEAFMKGLPKFKAWLKEHPEITWVRPKAAKVVSDKLAGKVVIFTGFRSKELEAFVVANGGSLKGKLDKNGILVAKDPSGNSSKLEKARAGGAKIMTEQQFRSMYMR